MVILLQEEVGHMSLGEYIAAKRKEKGWSQRELATASNISNAEISRLESGKRKEPSPSILKEIAKALEVPFEELLQAAGILGDYDIEKGREFVASRSDQPIPNDLTEEELAEYDRYWECIAKDARRRVGDAPEALQLVQRAKRLRILLEMRAPSAIIRNEARELALALALHRFATDKERT